MTEKVMIVDDNNIERESFISKFKAQGIQAVSTGDPTKALTLAINEKPDFIILDLYMPVYGGFDVLKTLKTDDRTKDIPVLFVTSSYDVNDVKTGFHLGCVDYFNKPVDIHSIISLIHRHRLATGIREAYQPVRKSLEKFVKKYHTEGDQVV